MKNNPQDLKKNVNKKISMKIRVIGTNKMLI